MKTCSAAFLAACLVLTPWLRVQAAPSSEVADQAAAHFEKGVELYREGSLDAALVEFERAYELVANHRLLFNLAQIQAERHDYAAAISLLEKYLHDGGAEIPEPRRIEAQQEIEKLQGRVAQLWVDSNLQGASLFVNDTLVGTLPLSQPLAINPGVCNVRVEKSGYETATKRVKVAGGERPRLNMPLLSPSRGSPRDPQGGPVANYTPLWISSAAVVAFGGATLAFGLTARSVGRDLDAELDQFPSNKSDVSSARLRLKTFAALTDACAAASLVSLGLAVYFLIDPPERRQSARRGTSRAALQVVPEGQGIALHGTF